MARAATHGIAQGALAEIQGGSFQAGFLGGAVGNLGGSLAQGLGKGDLLPGMVISGIAGGTASELGGGKFVNGAASGAIIYAFNHSAAIERTADSVSAEIRGRGVSQTGEKAAHAALAVPVEEGNREVVDSILIDNGFKRSYLDEDGQRWVSFAANPEDGMLVGQINLLKDRVGKTEFVQKVRFDGYSSEVNLISDLVTGIEIYNSDPLSYPFAGITGPNSNSFVGSLISHYAGIMIPNKRITRRKTISHNPFNTIKCPKNDDFIPRELFGK